MIQELITGYDTFELVRDKIASILALETASQQSLAGSAPGENPDDYKIRVFKERANAWEQFLYNHLEIDTSPVVNVWFDSLQFPENAGNVLNNQMSDNIYNIDVYGYGETVETENGQVPGDLTAALNAHRALRLCRKWIMADQYAYLDLRGLVGYRWPQQMQTFQPEYDANTVQKIVGARLALRVRCAEASPQYIAENLEIINSTIRSGIDGEILTIQQFDVTGP